MTLLTHQAVRYLVPLREGGSLPAVLGAFNFDAAADLPRITPELAADTPRARGDLGQALEALFREQCRS